MRAQRLSASQTGHSVVGSNQGHLEEVLNASRRHRLGHGDIRRLDRCQHVVLNASRRHRLGHQLAGSQRLEPAECSTPLGVTDLVTRLWPHPAAARGRAQRLSASQTWSHGSFEQSMSDVVVLNASRRHRLGHPRTAAFYGTGFAACSTPLGVTDLVTDWPIVKLGRRRVLNASRRHSLVTAAASVHLSPVQMCSTPLGVTDLVTIVVHRRILRLGVVLNASRRHRLGHLELRLSVGSPGRCAQRLSASQTWSRGHPQDTAPRRRWCSTPLGVTDLVTRLSCSSWMWA